MFIGLLSTCKIGSFGEPLAFSFTGPIKCVFLNNHPCQAKPTIVKVNFNQPLFYPLTVNVNKSSESSNTIDDWYAWICVPNKVKNMNLEVFKLISKENETRLLVHHKLCDRICRLNESVCNTKHGIIINVVLVKRNRWLEFLQRYIICGILVYAFVSVIRHVKNWQIFSIKNGSFAKCPICKLVLECEDEILNTNGTSLDNKKIIWKKKIVLLMWFH